MLGHAQPRQPIDSVMSELIEPAAYLSHSTDGPNGADAALRFYAAGNVPLAGQEPGTTDWVLYVPAGILDLGRLHLPRSLRKLLRKHPFEITHDTAFDTVVTACADPDRPGGWITPEIHETARNLFDVGHAHSVECWDAEGLAGGLYGMTIGGLFIGESMFTRRDNAGKTAFAALAALLIEGGFTEIDTQMPSDNLMRYGAEALAPDAYQLRRAAAMDRPAHWPASVPPMEALERLIAPGA